MSQKVKELLAQGFPEATITEKDNTFKLHVKEITDNQFYWLGRVPSPSCTTAKRSGTGITIIVTV